jgi:hypothetical protein
VHPRQKPLILVASKLASLSVAPERQAVVLLPRLPASSGCVVELVALAEPTGLLASGCEATRLAVLVDWLDDPVDAGIAADGLVLWVNENNLVVLVCGILVDPVGVEDTEVGATAADTFFGSGAEGALVLELVHTLVGGLAYLTDFSLATTPLDAPETYERCIRTISSTLWHWSLAATTANAHAVDDIALFGLVSETAGLVWSGWTGSTMDDVKLSELPAADTE